MYALATYPGTPLPPEYVSNDLGADISTMTSKIGILEAVTGIGGGSAAPVSITWKQFLEALGGLQDGGINVTNTVSTKERWGCLIKALEPGSYVDFRFMWEDKWGKWCSQVNPNKLVRVSPSGEAWLDINLGGAAGHNGFAHDDGRIGVGDGFVHVRGWPYGASTSSLPPIDYMCVAYFFEDV